MALAFATVPALAPESHGQEATSPPANWTIPSDHEIRELLAQIITLRHQGVGIVVGLIGPWGRRVIAYGKRDAKDAGPLDGDTEFPIDSNTKVFTALLLTDMVQRGEVRLTDPVIELLPKGLTVREHDGKLMTLVDLATHTAGLPTEPTNVPSDEEANHWADYTEEKLFAFLATYKLSRDPGVKWEYSNIGYGLLGDALAGRAGMDYETLVKARILGPLGMRDTSITLSSDQTRRLTPGHDSQFRRVIAFDVNMAVAGLGAFRSTANDTLTFLAAELGYLKTPLSAPMASMLTVIRPMATPTAVQALGWGVWKLPHDWVVNKESGTHGFRTYIAFMPRTRVGVVVLMNANTGLDYDDIGDHILTGLPVPSVVEH